MSEIPKRRCLKFSLRTLFAVITIFAIWLGGRVHHAQQQKQAIAAIEAIDGYYYYDYQYDPPETYDGLRSPPGPAWLWKLVDGNMFFDVAAVGLNSKPATDETMNKVRKLTQLQQLDLADAAQVTDRGLQRLQELNRLNYLRLDGTSISDGAAREYQRMHPTVKMVR
jgi:hypothetical protein